MSTTLNLENLGKIDGGKAAGIIQEVIDIAVKDFDAHGDDGKARKICS